ncbi:MAG TPA: hypothetical protein VEA78_10080 [Acidimicrobiales bacterium]|nr:hypothetical protein [Acidimicrobiales bacterium]
MTFGGGRPHVVLGRRHAVIESTAADAPAWRVVRCDLDGEVAVSESFGADDLLAAMVRAEELYLEDEATGLDAERSRVRLDLWRAFVADNTGDWELWQSLVHPDLALIDHSTLGWGNVDRAGVEQNQQAMREVAGTNEIHLRSVAIDGDHVLVEVLGTGTTVDGGAFEIAKWVIQSGRTRQEHFGPDQRDEAERRFRELTGGQP